MQFDKFADWFCAKAGLQRQKKRAEENINLHGIDSSWVQNLVAILLVGNEQLRAGPEGER